jgi:hypothetical protein
MKQTATKLRGLLKVGSQFLMTAAAFNLRDPPISTRGGLINPFEVSMWDSGSALVLFAMIDAWPVGVDRRTMGDR